MNHEYDDLKAACFNVARNTMWDMRPIDAERIQAHAERLLTIAVEKQQASEAEGLTIPMITRAVDYLRQVHALPPMKEDTQWFDHMLDVLLELIHPEVPLEGDVRLFLEDLHQSLEKALSSNLPG